MTRDTLEHTHHDLNDHPDRRSFSAGFWQTLRAVMRDKGAILLLVIAPLLYGFFYPWPYSTAVAQKVPVGIVDHDNSNLSRQIIRYASASPRLSVQVLSDEQAAQFALWRGQIDAYMIIPDSLKHDVVMRQPASVSIEGNGSYLLLNKEALTGLSEVVGTVSAGIEIRQYMAAGMSKNQAKVAQNPVPLLTQALYNPSQGYGSYVVPAVALLILQQTLLMGTALIIGTWVEQHKARTSARTWAGRVFALSCFGWLNSLIYFGWIFTVQGYTHGANWSGALLLAFVFAPVITSIGCVFGMWFKQRERGMQILLFSSLPMFFLSGFTWPTEALPQLLQYARWLLPSTPAIEASIRFNQIGTSLSQAWYLLAILALMGVLNFIFLCYIGRIRPNASSVSSTREQ
mgnify:FL=1